MRDLLLWSAIFILAWVLVGWVKWRYWVWMEER